MPIEHTVQPGECIDSIAFQHGFFPDTLWDHGDNAALKQFEAPTTVLEKYFEFRQKNSLSA